MLARCRGSALDIAIEKKLKKKAKTNDMMFNIGSLCKIPIGISKYTPPRKKWVSRHKSIGKQQNSPENISRHQSIGKQQNSPENNYPNYYNLSHIGSASEGES